MSPEPTSTSINKVPSSKLVKFYLWVSYLFKFKEAGQNIQYVCFINICPSKRTYFPISKNGKKGICSYLSYIFSLPHIIISWHFHWHGMTFSVKQLLRTKKKETLQLNGSLWCSSWLAPHTKSFRHGFHVLSRRQLLLIPVLYLFSAICLFLPRLDPRPHRGRRWRSFSLSLCRGWAKLGDRDLTMTCSVI